MSAVTDGWEGKADYETSRTRLRAGFQCTKSQRIRDEIKSRVCHGADVPRKRVVNWSSWIFSSKTAHDAQLYQTLAI